MNYFNWGRRGWGTISAEAGGAGELFQLGPEGLGNYFSRGRRGWGTISAGAGGAGELFQLGPEGLGNYFNWGRRGEVFCLFIACLFLLVDREVSLLRKPVCILATCLHTITLQLYVVIATQVWVFVYKQSVFSVISVSC